MLAVDVNILVSALRADARDHSEIASWLVRAVDGPELVAVSDAVLAGAVRILTHPRIFTPATPLVDALAEIGRLRSHPGVIPFVPGPRHWEILSELCRAGDATGNLVSDAQHAALAVEHGATWISKDRDFARFPGLRWRHPLV